MLKLSVVNLWKWKRRLSKKYQATAVYNKVNDRSYLRCVPGTSLYSFVIFFCFLDEIVSTNVIWFLANLWLIILRSFITLARAKIRWHRLPCENGHKLYHARLNLVDLGILLLLPLRPGLLFSCELFF